MSDYSVVIDYVEKNGSIIYIKNKMLCEISSFKTGGAADLFVKPQTIQAFAQLILLLRKNNIKYAVIGNASNVLFSDNGYNGVIVCTSMIKEISVEKNIIKAQCGVPLNILSQTAQKNGLSGLEFAYGIPGTVGGAVYMNAGAYGSELKNVIKSVRYYDIASGEIKTRYDDENDFSYRHSIYSQTDDIILEAEFLLEASDYNIIRKKMDANIASRKEKQPLEYPSAGSTFKRYPGYFTAQLIDSCGLKGYRMGGAMVSEKHAGFIINYDNATSSDIKNLISHIKSEIKEKYGIEIECEVKFID